MKIIKKLLMTVAVFVSTFMLPGCSSTTTGNSNASGNAISLKIDEHYKINCDSSIEDDFNYFDYDMKEESDALALSDLLAVFPDNDVFYYYFSMPKDTDQHAYRISTITVNDVLYDMIPMEIDGYYQKYVVNNCKIEDNKLYDISKLTFINEKDESYSSTYNLAEQYYADVTDTAYKFSIEHHYSITLSGQKFESVYQFNKNNLFIVDMWNHIINCPEGLDEDTRSFFYFAFNCYDTDRNIHFLPDDILQLEVKYTEQTYEYHGSNKEESENIVPVEKEIPSEIITPEHKSIITEDKRSNHLAYTYDTINKLTDADLKQNTGGTNKTLLENASKAYDWAVLFGDKSGYRNANAQGWPVNGKYDICYTKIKDFSSISIIYAYEGKKISNNVNSIVNQDTKVYNEKYHKPTDLEKLAEDNAKTQATIAQAAWYQVTWQFIVNTVINWLKSVLFWIIAGLIVLSIVFKLFKPTELGKKVGNGIKYLFTSIIDLLKTIMRRR